MAKQVPVFLGIRWQISAGRFLIHRFLYAGFYCISLTLTCSRGGMNHGIIHVNSRFRRDVRTLEEEEEHWFDQEDENGEDNVMMEQNDLLSDDSVFKSRKSFVSEKPAQSIVNNKRVSVVAIYK